MASRHDEQHARDYPQAFSEATDTVVRRIGGSTEHTEDVDGAAVELDSALGLVDGDRGQYFDFAGTMDIPAGQANSMHDTWVIDGEVYTQQGDAIGKDGGTQTIQLLKRKSYKGREPRVSR